MKLQVELKVYIMAILSGQVVTLIYGVFIIHGLGALLYWGGISTVPLVRFHVGLAEWSKKEFVIPLSDSLQLETLPCCHV